MLRCNHVLMCMINAYTYIPFCGKFRAISIGEIYWNENLFIKRITDFQLYVVHAHSQNNNKNNKQINPTTDHISSS